MCNKSFYVFSVVLVLGLVGNIFAQDPELDIYIPYTFEPPVLDAEVDAVWASASTQELVVAIDGSNPDSALDASGHWQVMWDSEYIYLIVEIVDSQLMNDSSSSSYLAGVYKLSQAKIVTY